MIDRLQKKTNKELENIKVGLDINSIKNNLEKADSFADDV